MLVGKRLLILEFWRFFVAYNVKKKDYPKIAYEYCVYFS